MLGTAAKDIRSLKERIQRFLNCKCYERQDVRAVISSIESLGDIAIFGGVPRDLSLYGNNCYLNDVDLVVNTDKVKDLETALSPYMPFRNAFGGYRVSCGKWKLDVWPLQSTWAFRSGEIHCGGLGDLVHTTFFNWDAIVYVVSKDKIYCSKNYLESLQRCILDINHQPNPNPMGTTIRTLRYVKTKNARLSPRLATYLLERIHRFDISAICSAEIRSYHRPVISEQWLHYVCERLHHYVSHDLDASPFSIFTSQLELPFSDDL